jgi:hypothetical protein
MKQFMTALTISTCLLFPAGVVFAANPHTVTGTTGQPGTNNGISCNSTTAGGLMIGGGPGGSVNANGSPFNPNVVKTYAGNVGNPTGPGGTSHANTAHAVSQYDVACFQHSQMP